MLIRLQIKNLVLVDSCELTFSPHFNVITGETGAGKSTLLTAIYLLLGERADPSLVRHGETKGMVEATFSAPPSSLLDELGIEDETITLRRELLSSGKSRAFINNHLVSLSFLKELGASLIEISDQHAGLILKHASTPLQLLDHFAHLSTSEFSALYADLKALQEQKIAFLQKEPLRQSEIEQISTQIEEIQTSRILEVDDSKLFDRFQEIEEKKELFEQGERLLSLIDNTLSSNLAKAVKQSDRALFSVVTEHLEHSSKHLAEAVNELNRVLGTLEICEHERSALEEQMKKIDAVRRRYREENIESVYQSLQKRLASLTNMETTLFELEEELSQKQKECDETASQLSSARIHAASLFSKHVQSLLPDLNMPHALFEVEVSQKERSVSGDDHVTFFLTPNLGEKRIELHEHASGGELARLYLAIQTVLAEQSAIPTILFDEIDASIGGVTANFVGKALSLMGQKRQVLAITHFVQVASQATSHFCLQKETSQGRTLTSVQQLTTKQSREEEQKRMVGTKSS